MRRVRAALHPAADGERGDSLIELMVVMIIFTLILGIITTAIVTMMQQVDKQSGIADNLGNARKAIEVLDGQVRFANAITTPGNGPSGDLYVEFRSIQNDQTQLCTQWRDDLVTKGLQYRTWQPPAVVGGPVTPTGWITTALSIGQQGTTPVFAIPQSSVSGSHQALAVTFVTTDGAPPQSSSSQVTITAINSLSSSAINNTVCQEAGRP